MKRSIALVISVVVLAGTIALAHGGNTHVRGIVTQVSAQSITVQTADKATKTLALTDKTTIKRSGKPAQLADVKVGDRVVIDVPEKTTNALLIQVGAAPKAAPHK
jgi:hypothetical protein